MNLHCFRHVLPSYFDSPMYVLFPRPGRRLHGERDYAWHEPSWARISFFQMYVRQALVCFQEENISKLNRHVPLVNPPMTIKTKKQGLSWFLVRNSLTLPSPAQGARLHQELRYPDCILAWMEAMASRAACATVRPS